MLGGQPTAHENYKGRGEEGDGKYAVRALGRGKRVSPPPNHLLHLIEDFSGNTKALLCLE